MKINLLNDYLKNTYGKKMYKLPLTLDVTCPNRDGTISDRGCIFCHNGGQTHFSQAKNLSVNTQIENAKALVKNKNKNGGYIAYFQSYTNTYGPIEMLKKAFFEALNNPSIDILSIATRPDCLGEDVLELLDTLNRIKPVWVELGLQSIHEKTEKYIRRGYPLSCYDEAVEKLKSIGINVIVHLIIGLPFESREDIIQSVRYVSNSNIDGIKLQLLHVLKDTDLYDDYKNGIFEVLNMEEYTDILIECIKNLSEDVVIHRLTGDGDKRQLTAPMWSADKRKVLNYINRRLREENVIQGECFKVGT